MVRIFWVTPYHSYPKYKDLLYINIEYIYSTSILRHSIYHSDPKHKDRLYINIEYVWYLYIEYTTLIGNIITFCTLILNINMVRIFWVTPYHSSPKYKDLLYINIEYIWYLYIETLYTTLILNIKTVCTLISNIYGTYILSTPLWPEI